MKMHHLRDFVAIADAQSIRGASRVLGMAQPALTRSLRELEKELGVALVERHGKGVWLTQYGQAFLVRSRSVLHDLQCSKDEIAQLQGGKRGMVSIGMSSALLLSMAPRVVADFKKAFPEVKLNLVEALFPMIDLQLRNGGLDFYIGPRPEAATLIGYSVERLFANQVVVACRQGHSLGNATSLSQLTGAQWILPGPQEAFDEQFNRQFSHNGLEAPTAITHTVTTLPALVLLAATDVLAFLPEQWISTPLVCTGLRKIAVREPLLSPDIVLMRRCSLPLTPVAQHLATLFERASCSKYLSPVDALNVRPSPNRQKESTDALCATVF